MIIMIIFTCSSHHCCDQGWRHCTSLCPRSPRWRSPPSWTCCARSPPPARTCSSWCWWTSSCCLQAPPSSPASHCSQSWVSCCLFLLHSDDEIVSLVLLMMLLMIWRSCLILGRWLCLQTWFQHWILTCLDHWCPEVWEETLREAWCSADNLLYPESPENARSASPASLHCPDLSPHPGHLHTSLSDSPCCSYYNETISFVFTGQSEMKESVT